jgi:hypothetical protein
MTPTPEQLLKLPKWAQDHVQYLERCLSTTRAEMRRLGGDITKTNVYVPGIHTLTEDFALQPNARVRFTTGPTHQDYVDVHHDRGALRSGSRVTIHGFATLVTRHHSSNLFTVEIDR